MIDHPSNRCDGQHIPVEGRPELCVEHMARRAQEAEAAEKLAGAAMTRAEAKADAEQAMRAAQEPVTERLYADEEGIVRLPDLVQEEIAAAARLLDMVNHPPHYTAHPSGVECITITEHMGFNVGNAVKYLWRADEKGNAVEDLQKAAWYVAREIERRTRG